jgi:hypothetical protein
VLSVTVLNRLLEPIMGCYRLQPPFRYFSSISPSRRENQKKRLRGYKPVTKPTPHRRMDAQHQRHEPDHRARVFEAVADYQGRAKRPARRKVGSKA